LVGNSVAVVLNFCLHTPQLVLMRLILVFCAQADVLETADFVGALHAFLLLFADVSLHELNFPLLGGVDLIKTLDFRAKLQCLRDQLVILGTQLRHLFKKLNLGVFL